MKGNELINKTIKPQSFELKPTTIWIKIGTKKRLDEIGTKGETYDDIINRIISQGKSAIPVNVANLKLYRQGVEARPFFVSIPYVCALRRLGMKTSFAYYIGNKNYSYWDQDVTTKLAMKEIMKHVNEGGYIQKRIKEWENIVEKQIEIEKTIERAINKKLTGLEKMGNNELIKTLRNIKALAETSWEIGITIELFDPDSEGIIMELLNKYDKNNITQKEFKVLCSPEILTYIQKELVNLYEIAEKKDYTRLEEHTQKFFWIKNTWADTVLLDKNFFRAKIARLEEEGINFRLEREKIYENLNTLKKEKKKILENKKPSLEIKRAIEFFEIMTVWRERRKKYALISNHHLNLIAKEISKRAMVEHELLLYSYADELNLPLDKSYVKELEKRKILCLQYVDENGAHFITGRVVEEFVNEIKGMTEQQVTRLYGNVANPGKVEGIAKIIFTTGDMSKMEKGDILVSPCTRPEYVPAMKKASAIITDEGGITSHAAIVSRELGVPCIVGLRNATDVIKDGDLILVNANHGIVQIMKRKM